MIDYPALRAEQERLRARGIHRGIGFASFIELTNPSPFMYGIGGARISAQDGCTVRIDPDGSVMAATGVTEQGQGTEAIIRQIVAEGVGVPIDQVRVITGDTLTTPYGGGTWACRGAGIGGEAALQAGIAVKEAALKVAGAMLQAQPDALDLVNGEIVERATGQPRMPLAELARIVYFRGDTLPPDLPRELMQTRHFITKEYPFAFTNGVQACWLEVDVDTGMVKLLKHLVRGGLRPHHQPAAGGRAGARRHRAGHRRRALRALHLLARGPAAGRLHGRLPGADGGRDARHRGRPRRDADEGIAARRQGRGRGRHRRRAGAPS